MNSVYGLIALAVAAAAPPSSESTIEVHTDSPFFASGELLLKACTADEKTTNGPEFCKNYVGAVVDTIVSNRDTIQGYQICWPKPAPDLDALSALVVKYLRDHPEFSNGIAASVVSTALYDTYRCPNSHPPSGDQFPHKN